MKKLFGGDTLIYAELIDAEYDCAQYDQRNPSGSRPHCDEANRLSGTLPRKLAEWEDANYAASLTCARNP
jgi:hypothetical protein